MRASTEPAFSAPLANWTAVATPRKSSNAGRQQTSLPLQPRVQRKDSGQQRRVRVAHRLSVPNEPLRGIVLPSPPKAPIEDRSDEKERTSKKTNRGEKGKTASEVSDGRVADELAALIARQQASILDEALLQTPTISDSEREEREYLDEQLRLRQQEVQTAETKKKRGPAKRTRSSNAASVGASRTPMKDSFQAYMEEISREGLLDQAEVIGLAKQIRSGVEVENAQRTLESKFGRRPSVLELAEKLSITPTEVQKRRMVGTAAKNHLVSSNLRLVTSVARKVQLNKAGGSTGITLDDMVQEGSVGLIRAAEKFDASRGYKFSTYATWWVRAYVMRSITTMGRSIKVPSTIVDEYSRIRKEYSSLREDGVFHPKDEDVAKSLGITPAKLRFVINVVKRVPTSLDITLDAGGDGNSRTLSEIVEGDDNVEERMVEDMQRKELDSALRKYLKPLERAVIRLRFGLDDGQQRTLRETGELLGLSKERIRQLLFRALPKMKNAEIQQMLVEATTR